MANGSGVMGRPENKAFSRRVRQHVQGPLHQFAVIVPPELRLICQSELKNIGIQEPEASEAGVEFVGKLRECYKTNLWLRTASRVLCRMPPFRAGIVEELFFKTSIMPWELWLNPEVPIQVEAHVERSRISHEGLTEDAVYDGMRKRFGSQNLPLAQALLPRVGPGSAENGTDRNALPWKQKVLVHLRENHCQISLDTSGPHLHQRGYRTRHAGAPLRETLAAAILEKIGWRGESPFIDGMCGAGTFAIEAALISRALPPGLGREFLFQKWPSFEEKSWDYLKRIAREKVLPKSPCPIIGVDVDMQALTIARQNAARGFVEQDIRWECADFLSFTPERHNLSPGWIMLNPPYGRRLTTPAGTLYEDIGTHLRRSFRGWKAVILTPDRSLAMGLRLSSARFWNLKHGGISLIAVIGKC